MGLSVSNVVVTETCLPALDAQCLYAVFIAIVRRDLARSVGVMVGVPGGASLYGSAGVRDR